MKAVKRGGLAALQKFEDLKFRKKLIISYLALIIIPITALGIFSLRQAESLLYQQLKNSQVYNVKQMVFNLGSRLEKSDEFIRFTAFSPYLMEDFNGPEKNWYEITQKMNDYFEPVSWYTMSHNRDFEKMKIYFEHLEQPIGTFIEPSAGVEGEGWYQDAQHNQATDWTFIDSELYAVRRIYNANNNTFIGVIRVQMNTPYLMDTLTKGATYTQGLVLSGRDNRVLYANTLAQSILEQQPDFLQVHDTVMRIGREQYYVARAEVEGYDWEIYTLVPITDYTDQTNNILRLMVVLIAVCLVVLLGLIWLFSYTLVKRLARLDEYICRVEEGGYDVVISSSSKDEIGRLTNSFGRMVQKTDRLINQVYKSELSRQEEELKSLQSQVNPHFLYNTLSLINWKALDAENEEISQLASFLFTFYRTCLNKGQSLTIVANEIESIRAYINIQQVMHSNSFDVVYEIDERALPVTIVNFSLEPLVENAIVHGLDEKEDFHGTLWIRAEIIDECVRFSVADNGTGMSEETIHMVLKTQGQGYGIYNVDKRTKLHFGEQYGINITSVRGEGTTVYLTIPLTSLPSVPL